MRVLLLCILWIGDASGAELSPAPSTAPASSSSVATPTETPALTTSATPAVKWTLSQVKGIAFEHNPDLASAKDNYEAAQKGVGVAFSGYLPHVSVNARYDQTTLPNPSAGATSQLGESLPYQMVTANVSQVLFDFGKVLNQIGTSRAYSNGLEQQAVAVKNAVELAVEKAFYNVEATRQLVSVAEKGLSKYQEIFRRTEVLVRTQTRPKFDLTQATVEVAKARSNVINAQNAYEYAKTTLLDVMGLLDPPSFTLVDEGLLAEYTGISSSKLSLPKLVERAMKLRPEVKRQEFSLEASRSKISESTKDYLPTLFVQGWVGKYLPSYPDSISDSYGVGVGLTWHIFDGLETTFRTGQLSAKANSEEAQLNKDKLLVTGDVTRGFNNLIRSEENLKVAEEQLTAAKENRHLAQRRYDVSMATILELLVAENSLLNSEAAAVTAKFDHQIALASLQKAVNGSLTE